MITAVEEQITKLETAGASQDGSAREGESFTPGATMIRVPLILARGRFAPITQVAFPPDVVGDDM